MARSDSSKDSSSASSKKVAKAARAGAAPSSAAARESRSLGFPMAMLGVIVLGTALVAFAWQGRDASALTPTFGDHWHIPYGIYDCTEDGFVDPFSDNGNPGSGVHTHQDATGLVGDGVVHLHPQSSIATGSGATLDRIFESVTASMDGDDEITFSDRPALTEEGVECDGEPAILQIVRFPVQLEGENLEPIEVITEDLASFRFDTDFQPFVIALAPEGAEIPLPPQAAFDGAYGASPFVQSTAGLDGVEGLDDLDFGDGTDADTVIGFNDEGVLVDPATGEPILDPDGNEITNTPAPDADADEDSEE